MSDKPLTAKEYARRIGRTYRVVVQWLQDGKVPGAYKLGSNTSPWLIPVSALDPDNIPVSGKVGNPNFGKDFWAEKKR